MFFHCFDGGKEGREKKEMLFEFPYKFTYFSQATFHLA